MNKFIRLFFLMPLLCSSYYKTTPAKITHIIFDFGDVIANLEPEWKTEFKAFMKTTAVKEAFVGKISAEEALNKMQLELPATVDFARITELWRNPSQHFTCSEDIKKIFFAAKRAGYKTYILSNLCSEIWENFEQNPSFAFLKLFDGVVLSSRVHAAKPLPEIYSALFNLIKTKEHIDNATAETIAKTCLFFDDKEENILAGDIEFAMPGIVWPGYLTLEVELQIADYCPTLYRELQAKPITYTMAKTKEHIRTTINVTQRPASIKVPRYMTA